MSSTFRVIALVVPLISTLSCGFSERLEQAQTIGVAPRTQGEGAFVQAWSTSVDPPLVHEMALSPERWGFLALNNDRILRFDELGQLVSAFDAPNNSTRVATDPTGRFPHALIVSSTKKWTGAIDYLLTTGYTLHAVDLLGREIWRKNFDPKDISSPEPSVSVVDAAPAIVLSAGKRISRFDRDGHEQWSLPLWHHPGTVTAADLPSGPRGGWLAALAPRGMIVRISPAGEVVGPWAPGDGPSRLRAVGTDAGLCAISMRLVVGRGAGVHVLSFFDESGTVVREVDLPPDVGPLSYSPISVLDVDGSGQSRWVIASGNGLILVFSVVGEELARFATGARLRTVMALPQRHGPDLLVVATHRGLTAWRPVPARLASSER